MPRTTPRPPAHLSAGARAWFSRVVAEHELDQAQVKMLTVAAETWDRYEQARKALNKDGLTYLDRFDAPRARPEVAVERDSRLAFERLVRALGLREESRPNPEGKFSGAFG